MLPIFCLLTTWAISLEFRGKPSMLEADDFLGVCSRKAMTPQKLWTLLFPKYRKDDCSRFASQAAWYRMENGPNSKNGKIGQKRENGPPPENGEKMGFGAIFLFFRHFWAIFRPFRAEGHFLFFGQFFPFFGVRPVFHSIPGGLTCKSRFSFVCVILGYLFDRVTLKSCWVMRRAAC